MLQLGNGMSAEEEQTHFAMWCMMSSPLVIGCDLTGISESTLAVLKNRELIAVNQDPACSQAYVIKEYRKPDRAKRISPEAAKALQEKGALLLDVRSEAEYEKSHFPGAVSMPYTEIHAGIVSLAADRVQPVILCCATGKRSAQACDTLGYMGYKNIYDLGGILT